MILNFPRGLKIDIENPPSDFEEQIKQCFHDYTEGTAKEYTYQDKLAFIDRIRELSNDVPKYSSDAVMELMKSNFETQVLEFGEFPDEDDFLSMDFMEVCYDAGKNINLYSHYDRQEEKMRMSNVYISHLSDKIMDLVYRAIKVVIEYES